MPALTSSKESLVATRPNFIGTEPKKRADTRGWGAGPAFLSARFDGHSGRPKTVNTPPSWV